MTNEEAIKVLLDEWKCIDRNDGINCDRKCESCDLVMDSFVLKDAYNMAIKALEYDDAKYHAEHGEVIVDKAVWEDAERALQEQCGDAISREDVINLKWQGEASEEFLEGYASAIEDARVLPPVNPQERTGHWILQPSNKEHGERDFIWWKCSECGQVIYSETEKERREYHAFCGKCGARMVEPKERSE